MDDQRWPVRARELIGRPVRLGTVQLGTVSDVIASGGLGHLLGFEVQGRDAYARFLPWVGAEIEADHVAVRSVFSLLSCSELALYVDHGVRLRARLDDAGTDGDKPRDLLVDADGDVSAVLFGEGRAGRRGRLEAVPAAEAPSTRPAA